MAISFGRDVLLFTPRRRNEFPFSRDLITVCCSGIPEQGISIRIKYKLKRNVARNRVIVRVPISIAILILLSRPSSA